MWHIWGTGVVHMGFWLGDLSERDHFEDLGRDGRMLLRGIFKNWGEEQGLD
jgi:hypothetical protein